MNQNHISKYLHNVLKHDIFIFHNLILFCSQWWHSFGTLKVWSAEKESHVKLKVCTCRYFMDMVHALFFFLCNSAIILEINLAYFRLIYSSKVYIPLAESAKCWLFDQVRGIIQNACLFSTDLNKIFHIKDVYMQSTRENNSWTYKNDPFKSLHALDS